MRCETYALPCAFAGAFDVHRSLWIASVGLLALVGCVHSPTVPFLEQLRAAGRQSETWLQWPAAPAEARVRYLGAIETERDIAPRSLWGRLRGFVLGEAELRFVRPAAIAQSGALLAISDPGAGSVHLLDLERRRWQEIRDAPGGGLLSPIGVAFLPDGTLIVSDSARGVLWRYDAAGRALGGFGSSDLKRPTGLLFEAERSRLWVAETLRHRLRAFDLDGREVVRVGSRGEARGRFNYPTWLAADAGGGLWVTDSLNFRLQHIGAEGVPDAAFGAAGNRAGTFSRPRGLAVDSRRRLFVVDALFDAVQIFEPSGQLLLVFGERGTGPGQFWLPSDVLLDAQGIVYVVDSYNQRVQIFQYRPPEAP